MSRLVILLIATLAAVAAAGSAMAACVLQKVGDLPVTMVGLRPMISAQINGQDVRLFIDTGSFWSMLSPAAAARLGLRTGALPPFIEVRGATGEADVRLANAKTFTLLGLPFRDVDFLVAEHALSADGLLGENVLHKLDIEFDLANGVVRLFLAKDCGDRALAYWSQDGAFAEAPIEPDDANVQRPSGMIISTAKVNGARIRVLFDTGSPRSSLTVGGARRAGVAINGPGVDAAGQVSSVGRRLVESWLAPFASFEIGGEQVKSTRLRIADFDLQDADMLLGADFFLSHRIFIARSQRKIYFTYNGGPVFNLEQGVRAPPPGPPAGVAGAAGSTAPQTQAAEAPKDADGFARRAAAFVARHEYDEAIADYGQAIALEPSDAKHVSDRGVARLLNHQPVLAMEDFDAALKLKPDDVPALMLRGDLRLAIRNEAGARADFDAALHADPGVAIRVGDAYARAGLYEAAVGEFDQVIAGHPKNEDLAGPLAARCRARALWGQQLDQAVGDCNQSLRYRPDNSDVLASRGLARLRQGQLDPAIADFDAAIRVQPRAAWALYGRGIAKSRKGLKDQGDADIAAATAIAPRLPDQARKAGFAP